MYTACVHTTWTVSVYTMGGANSKNIESNLLFVVESVRAHFICFDQQQQNTYSYHCIQRYFVGGLFLFHSLFLLFFYSLSLKENLLYRYERAWEDLYVIRWHVCVWSIHMSGNLSLSHTHTNKHIQSHKQYRNFLVVESNILPHNFTLHLTFLYMCIRAEWSGKTDRQRRMY